MRMCEYLKSRSLTVKVVAQEMGISNQAVSKMGVEYAPTAKTLKKVAQAMTNLGVPTTAADLVEALYDEAKAE